MKQRAPLIFLGQIRDCGSSKTLNRNSAIGEGVGLEALESVDCQTDVLTRLDRERPQEMMATVENATAKSAIGRVAAPQRARYDAQNEMFRSQ